MARYKDPIDKLNLRADVAVRQFAEAADELEEVAQDLKGIAVQADQAATAASIRAAHARQQAAQAGLLADRIRELLG